MKQKNQLLSSYALRVVFVVLIICISIATLYLIHQYDNKTVYRNPIMVTLPNPSNEK